MFYDRATNRQLESDGCVPVNASFEDLFGPLMTAKDPATNAANPAYINDHLELGSSLHFFNCNATDTSACVNTVYDARAYYDHDTNRFWIVAAARNPIWTPCDNTGKCSVPCGSHQACFPSDRCEKCSAEARRYVFVAVSKAEDPRKGFFEYVLVRDYADWPLFSVRNGRLILGHNDASAKRIYVFDATKLAAGTNADPYLGVLCRQGFSRVRRYHSGDTVLKRVGG